MNHECDRCKGDIVVIVWKGIHSGTDISRTGAKDLFFYYLRLLYGPDQMLAVMELSKHRVSSSKTVRPSTPCSARCMKHAIRTWSAICSMVPQFGEGARTHSCTKAWNRPTPIYRRLSLTQAQKAAASTLL